MKQDAGNFVLWVKGEMVLSQRLQFLYQFVSLHALIDWQQVSKSSEFHRLCSNSKHARRLSAVPQYRTLTSWLIFLNCLWCALWCFFFAFFSSCSPRGSLSEPLSAADAPSAAFPLPLAESSAPCSLHQLFEQRQLHTTEQPESRTHGQLGSSGRSGQWSRLW